MERIHSRDCDVGQQVALVAPVDLSLRTRDDLEPAVQTRQRVVVTISELGSDPRPSISEEHLDPLIITGEAVLGDQPLMDHRALQRQIGPQPRLDPLHERINQPWLGTRSRRCGRGDGGARPRPDTYGPSANPAALTADLDERSACLVQSAETTNVHPGLRIQDHEQVTLRSRLLGG
jgi:hypothetical protein